MSKPLLITTGCSWTADDHVGYIKNNIRTWPHIISDFMNWDLINVAKSGQSNNFICDKAIDAIVENEDREIIVFSYWTQPNRLSVFDTTFLVFNSEPHLASHTDNFVKMRYELKNHFVDLFNIVDENDQEEIVMNVINQSLRSVYLLDDFCKKRNIKILHNTALPIINGAHWVLDKEKKLKAEDARKNDHYTSAAIQSSYYEKIEAIENKVVNSFFDNNESGFHKIANYLIRGDKHPNQKGHQLIAFEFMNKYEELFAEKFKGPEPVFIYD